MFLNTHTHDDSAIFAIINLFGKTNLKHTAQPEKFYSIGIHPWFAENFEMNWLKIVNLSSEQNVLAIGEAGLDKVCQTNFDLQQVLFEKQIDLGQKLKKPLIIHAVKAHQELVSVLLKKKFTEAVVFHGFNQRLQILKICQKLPKVYFSFGVSLLNQKSISTTLIQQIPLSQIFFETDDSPISIKEIYAAASEILKIDMDSLKKQIEKNWLDCFGALLFEK
jgi:TatD DNase family protein